MKIQFKLATAVLALATAAFAGVGVSSPANGSTVGSPAHFVATASSGAPIVAMKVYVDNNIMYSTSSAKIDAYVPMSGGSHYVVVQAWDSAGAVMKAPLTVNVSGGSAPAPSPTPTGNFKYTQIQAMSGWTSCGACAGAGGNGPSVPYSMSQYQKSPSMTGASSNHWLGGSTPYASALWWKQLGGNNSVSNFVYDLYFYVTNPAAPQALEFDVNQSANGLKYIFGTECNIRETHTWRVWNTAGAYWVNSGVPCATPQAYSWNHLTLEFKRVGNTAQFVAVTLNGAKSYFNRSYYARSSSVSEVNVAFQMDGNYAATNYNTWLDRVSLNYW